MLKRLVVCGFLLAGLLLPPLGSKALAQDADVSADHLVEKVTETLVVFELREGQEQTVLLNPNRIVRVNYNNLEKNLMSRVDYRTEGFKPPDNGYYFILKPGQPHVTVLGDKLERVWFKVIYGRVKFTVHR